MDNFEELVKTRYIINGYLNLFKLSEDSKLIQVFLTNNLKNKISLYLKSTNIESLDINKNYKIKDVTKGYWLKNLEKLPVSLIRNIIISWHVKNKSKETDLLEDLEFFLKDFEYFVCKGSFTTKLPNKISKDLLYLTGIIMGDGSLPNKHNGNGKKQYEITIEKANREFVYRTVKPLFLELFSVKPNLLKDYKRDKIRYRCYIKSRIIFAFLNNLMGIPTGKKSCVLKFPHIIKNLSLDFKLALFAGLVDTDWGKQRWIYFGTHMGSKNLSEDYKDLLHSLGIGLQIKRYVQKEKFVSYQCYLRKGDEQKLFNILSEHYPLKNAKRIKLLKAGVAELGKCASISKSNV